MSKIFIKGIPWFLIGKTISAKTAKNAYNRVYRASGPGEVKIIKKGKYYYVYTTDEGGEGAGFGLWRFEE